MGGAEGGLGALRLFLGKYVRPDFLNATLSMTLRRSYSEKLCLFLSGSLKKHPFWHHHFIQDC